MLTGNVIGTVAVSCNSVPVGHFKFKVKITAAVEGIVEEDSTVRSAMPHSYKKVFISYASQDRDEVLKRVQMLSHLKVNFFQDIVNLEPGDRWESELHRHIAESDLFLLFWSNAAKESKLVLQEVRYALQVKGGDDAKPPEILPVIIEGPPMIEPPEELSHLHFNDKLLYLQTGDRM